MTTIAIKRDLRHLFGPIRDQGQRPTCLAFAASDLHAALREPWAQLSCEYLFYHAQKRAKRKPHQGALLPETLDAVRDDGQPHESGWPYLTAPPAHVSEWKPPPGISPLFRRAGHALSHNIDAMVRLGKTRWRCRRGAWRTTRFQSSPRGNRCWAWRDQRPTCHHHPQ
jgi:hypothetical protein